MTIDTSIQNARTVTRKFETLNNRSAEVSNGLRKHAEGSELYEAVQAAERTTRKAKQAWDAKLAEHEGARRRAEESRKKLMAVCNAIVRLTEAFGICGAADVMVADNKDEGAIASNLSDFAAQVPEVGDGLTSLLAQQRTEWLALEAERAAVHDALDQTGRAYGHAFYRSNAVVAQAKAFLFAVGIPVIDRQSPRRKKVSALPAKPAANEDVAQMSDVA